MIDKCFLYVKKQVKETEEKNLIESKSVET